MLSDYLVSLIRTFVPIGVGIVLAYLAKKGFNLTVDAEALTLAVIGVYYAVVRKLEARWSWLGWLLGTPKAPTYGS